MVKMCIMELGLKNELTIEDMVEDLNIKFGLTFKIEWQNL